VTVNGTTATDNDKEGLKVTEDGDGSGTLRVRGSNIDDIDTDVTEL
jgi:hypothetical protein